MSFDAGASNEEQETKTGKTVLYVTRDKVIWEKMPSISFLPETFLGANR